MNSASWENLHVVGEPRVGSSFVTGDAVNVAARLEQAAGAGDAMGPALRPSCNRISCPDEDEPFADQLAHHDRRHHENRKREPVPRVLRRDRVQRRKKLNASMLAIETPIAYASPYTTATG